VRLGATPDGKLLSLQQDYRNHTSSVDDITRKLRRSHALPLQHRQPPRQLRAGQAQHRHAHADARPRRRPRPLRARVRHGRARHQAQHGPRPAPPRPRHPHRRVQRQALLLAPPQRVPPGRRGKVRLVQTHARRSAPCATATSSSAGASPAPVWGAGRGVSQCAVSLRDDGTARASSATQDIGTGTYTVIAQIVSDRTGIPVNKIDVVLGDSSLPPGPMSGGSTATATVIPSVARRRRRTPSRICSLPPCHDQGSPFFGKDAATSRSPDGRIHSKTNPPTAAFPSSRFSSSPNSPAPTAKANPAATSDTDGQLLQPQLRRAVRRGAVGPRHRSPPRQPRRHRHRRRPHHQPKPATNQIAGAVVMGVGMALFERPSTTPATASHQRQLRRLHRPHQRRRARRSTSTSSTSPTR
jgi:xanthine dehydrogenase YagR molybdenum-binding subunit